MYIFEKLIQIFNKFTKKEDDIIPPSYETTEEPEDALTCKHTFMPIDSTGEILACSKCGYLIRKDQL